MFLPDSFPAALTLMLIGMVCWGSWANPYKLTRHWPFELFYLDYAMGIFATSVIAALTLGMLYGAPNAWENLRAADGSAWLYAVLAGVVLNCGNVLLTAAMARVGMATAFPVSIGISFVAGTALSYLVTPRGDPALLSSGVLLVLAAVVVNAAAYRSAATVKPEAPRAGLGLCVAAGLLLCGFGPLVAKALASTRPLAPYPAAVLFTLGALISTLPLLRYVMPRLVGAAPRTLNEYRGGSAVQHWAGWAAGVIWGSGTVAAFIAANTAGMALSGAIGQANPLIAALWGVFVWHEFAGAPRRARSLLAVMFALYTLGIVLLALSFEA